MNIWKGDGEMKRRCAVGLVAGLLLVACLPAHAIVLRYRPKVDQVTKHKMTMAGRMEMSVEGMGQLMQMEISGTLNYAEKALSETAEATRVETRLTGGTMTAKGGGQSQTQDMPTGRMVADIDPRGRVVKMVSAEFEGEDAMGQGMGPGAETWSTMPAQFGAFPEGDINVDDTWTEELKIPTAPDGPEMTMNLESQLLALTTFQGRKCAKVRTSFEGPMDLDMADFGGAAGEVEGTMDAMLQGDMLWYYDYENSIYVYGEGAVGMDMNISVAGADMPGGMNAQMLMNVKMSLAE
jgi:hypothetical protein